MHCYIVIVYNIYSKTFKTLLDVSIQWRTKEFFSEGGGVQQIQLRTEDRDDGDLGAVAP